MRVGAVTIGQSPRDDVIPELSRHLGSGMEIVQWGALDGLSLDSVRKHEPEAGESTLVSRMRDGTEVEIEKNFVLPRLQAGIHILEQEVQLILLLCTAPFEPLESSVPLLRPGKIVERVVHDMMVKRLVVLTPSYEQIPAQHRKWCEHATEEVVVEAASPYSGSEGIEQVATRLLGAEVDLVVMDCIGYTSGMKADVRKVLNIPVLTATGLLARVASEMLA